MVALTKMDMCGFRESAFDDARETIRSLCEELELAAEFVPTCVEVRERESHNVFCPSDKKMPWYDGPTFVEALQRHLGEVAASYEEVGGLLLSVDRELANPRSHAGKTWQVKVLNGILKQGERIRLAPVVDSNREFISVSGEVKQIRANLHRDEQLQVVEEASAGDIVGLDLRSIASDAGRRISKSEFNALYTTCGFAGSSQYSVSHRFRCSVDESFTYLFTPGRQFGLVWFGRTVEFQVQSAEQSQEGLLVLCQLLARPIAMPSRGSQGLMRSTVIIRTGLQEEEFIQGRLLDIG